MNVCTMVGHFFLSVWLWSITWGIYQAPFAAFCMFLWLKFRFRMNMVPAVLIALGANFFSFAVYSLLVVSILITALGFEYVPHDAALAMPLNDGVICISLAFIDTVIQTLLFRALHAHSKLNMLQVLTMCVVSNGVAAWLVYVLLPLYR